MAEDVRPAVGTLSIDVRTGGLYVFNGIDWRRLGDFEEDPDTLDERRVVSGA